MNEASKTSPGAAPPPNPLDDLSIQAPGRLLTLEVLFALMARHHPQRETIFREAQAMLAKIESDFQADDESTRQKLGQMFLVSRAWLAKLETESAS